MQSRSDIHAPHTLTPPHSYVSKSAFITLAGDDQEALNKGRLSSSVNWKFINESCVFCEGGVYACGTARLPLYAQPLTRFLPSAMPCSSSAGYAGILPDGSGVDPCYGADHFGIERHGRKVGSERSFGEEAEKKCPPPTTESTKRQAVPLELATSLEARGALASAAEGDTPGAQAKLQKKAMRSAEYLKRKAAGRHDED